MSDPLIQLLPTNLRAQTLPDHAGDAVSLIGAIEFHLSLQKDLRQPVSPDAPPTRTIQLQPLIEAFVAAPNLTALLKIWQRVPRTLEAAFVAGVETSIAQDTQSGATERAAATRQHLDVLQKTLAEQRATQAARRAAGAAPAGPGRRRQPGSGA